MIIIHIKPLTPHKPTSLHIFMRRPFPFQPSPSPTSLASPLPPSPSPTSTPTQQKHCSELSFASRQVSVCPKPVPLRSSNLNLPVSGQNGLFPMMGFALQRLLSNGYRLGFWISCFFHKWIYLMDSVVVLIDEFGSQVSTF